MEMKQLLRYIEARKDNVQMEMVHDIMLNMSDYIKEISEEKYDCYWLQLYEIAYGEKLSQEMAECWVNSMRPYAKWSMEETNEVISAKSLRVDPIEFYVVMNMMYSDYGEMIPFDLDTYIRLSIAWLQDADAGEHKLYNYWKYIIK